MIPDLKTGEWQSLVKTAAASNTENQLSAAQPC